MSDFYRDNRLIMLVIYSIMFFLMAFAILLKCNRKSGLKMARSLWLLAGYGITHGLNEIVVIAVHVKESQMSDSVLFALHTLELALKALSFIFIFWLGIYLVLGYYKKYDFLKIIGAAMSIGWFGLVVYALMFHGEPLYLALADNLSRYMFAAPGFLLSGVGLWLHVREVEAFRIPYLVRNLKALALTFFIAVFAVGLVANEPVLWPATVLNRHTFLETVGIPVIFFRSLFLLFTTYFVIRIVDVFEVEREFRLEEALRRQVLSHERERIARELHDGIIQSIYGVGLKLEQATILAEKRLKEARTQINSAKDDLNSVIRDIRDYIEELKPVDLSPVSLREGIIHMVGEFRERAIMQVELVFEGQQGSELNIIQINNIIHALQELLTNAVKHSRAENVVVNVKFNPEEIIIRVDDDGEGFDPDTLKAEAPGGEKQGLRNVFNRVSMLQGTVAFYTSPGRGAHFEICLPYRKLGLSGGFFINDPEYFKRQAN
ncbi:MAG: sensor histidine kinase [Dethiobacter sp.]|nr:sensor histidine kinase [Dethiobacter sp.]